MQHTFEIKLLATRLLALGFLAALSILVILAFYGNKTLALTTLGVLVLAGIYVRYRPPMQTRTVVLKAAGITMVERKLTIPWDRLKWYRIDENHPVVNVLSIGVRGRLFALRLSGMKTGEELRKWQQLRKGIVYQGKKRNPAFRNYFDHWIWTGIAYGLLLLWIGVLLSMFVTGIHWDRLGSLIISFVYSLRLGLMIYSNRQHY